MSEDERLEMVRTATEAHSGLREIAFRLRQRLPTNAAVAKAAVRAEQEAFRFKLGLQWLDISGPAPAPRRGPLPEVRQGGKGVNVERLRRGRGPDEER